MSTAAPHLAPVSGAPFRVAIVAASYNERLIDGLLGRVREGLLAAGVKTSNLTVVRVPGSNEIPFAAHQIARRKKPDAVIALGVIIRGDTRHYELIGDAVTHALQNVSIATERPVINGVVVAENDAQAVARCIGPVNRGVEFARAALAMAALRRQLLK
ncbi:MAG TPA: 6,7-dimethyl-8-ribityllumazine synthase [Opitutaceae bacterium]|jgi:6,7-dimethyl-8-ribityllumazine synthase